MTKLSKGVCSYCNININLGQLVIECVNCNANIHAKCCKRAGYVIVDNNWTCNFCTSQHTTRYNPVKIICDDDDHSSNIPHDTIHSLQNITTILKSCKSYDNEEFNKIAYTLNAKEPKKSLLSTYFYNIDGNAFNFDAFVTEL